MQVGGDHDDQDDEQVVDRERIADTVIRTPAGRV
jgi:hypothetical protein